MILFQLMSLINDDSFLISKVVDQDYKARWMLEAKKGQSIIDGR